MNLQDCIKRAGKSLDAADKAAIEQFMKDGLGDSFAVTRQLRALDAEMGSIIERAKDAGAIINVPESKLRGAPGPVNVPGKGDIEFKPFQKAIDAAKRYAEKAGIPYVQLREFAPLDTARATRIAGEFQLMKHQPQNPSVKKAYQAMIDETLAQFEVILETGLKIEFIKGDDPYSNSPREAILDVIGNNHMWVFSTKDGFGSDDTFDPKDNPLLQDTKFTDANGEPMLANDVFRVVHDYFGHIKNGVGFRARGEENAWQAHASMYSPLARRAMTVETRGQNSWVNYGPHGENNRTASAENTIFADQKIGLLPIWVSEEGRLSETTRSNDRRFTRGLEGAIRPDGRLELIHYSRGPIKRTDPIQAGTGLDRGVRDRYIADVTYFGIESANENGYRREAGLGQRRNVVTIEPTSLYPADTDPEGLWVPHNVQQSIENMRNAGFSGYWADNPQIGKVAAVWDNLIVEEQPGSPFKLFQKEQAPRGPTGLYSGLMRSVLNLNLPQWNTKSKKQLKPLNARISALQDEYKEIRALWQQEEKAFDTGLIELRNRDGVTADEVKAYVDNYVETETEDRMRAVEKQLRDLRRERDADPAARAADIWAKLSKEAKKEEILWTGIKEFLTADPDRKLTRTEVANYLNENGVNVEVVTADESTKPREIEFDWAEIVDESRENWEHRIEDFMADYNANTPAEIYSGKVDLGFIDLPEYGAVIDYELKNAEANPDNFGVRDLLEQRQRYDDMIAQHEAGQLSLEGIPFELHEVIFAREDVHHEIINIVGQHDNVKAELNEMFDDAAREQYMEDPLITRRMDFEGVEIEVTGTDDYGYTGYVDGRQINEEPSYNIHQMEGWIEEYLANEGITNEGSDAPKWESYTMPGVKDNYREIKLTLPDISDDFYNTVHFDDRNILGFLRVDDRALAVSGYDSRVNTYFIDELQSDWGTAGREHGFKLSDEEIDSARRELASLEVEYESLITQVLGELHQLDVERSEQTDRLVRRALSRSTLEVAREFLYRQDFDSYELEQLVELTKRHFDRVNPVVTRVNELQRIRDSRRWNTVPRAPFIMDDTWLSLALKHAIVDAVNGGYDAIGWPNHGTLDGRYSRGQFNYRPQYNQKMPSIIRKLTKQQAVQFDDVHDPISSEPTRDQLDAAAVYHDWMDSREAVVQMFDGDDQIINLETGELLPGLEIVEHEGRWNLIETKNLSTDRPGYWTIPITDELRERVKAESFPLFQGTTKGYYDADNSVIRLTEASDASTFIHEFAHFMLEMERSNNGVFKPKIDQWFKRHIEQIAEDAGVSVSEASAWLEFGGLPDQAKSDAVRRATHEMFAEAFEQYTMEGKSPSIELRNAFRAFASWLAQIYRRLSGALSKTLDDDMRRVFDSMLATEDQIEAAALRQRLEPLFTDQTLAGMTDKQWEKYNENTAAVKNAAKETLRDKLIAAITKSQKRWWNQEKADIATDEEERLRREEPVYRAIEALKGDDLKLDHAAVKDLHGETRTNKRGHTAVHIPTAFRGMTAKGAEGVSPDDAAAFLGFDSGEQLLDAILAAPTVKQAAEAAAEQIMQQRHGDVLDDAQIQQLADEALQNEERAKVIMQELRALRSGRNVTEAQVIKQLAEEKIDGLSFREINPGRYRAAEIRSAQEAATALAKGDRVLAADAKQRQLLNHYLASAAMRARNDATNIVDRMSRYRKKPVRERIMRNEGGFMEQIDRILQRFEFRKSASMASVDRRNESLQVWVERRQKEEGDNIVLSPAVLDEAYQTHWKNVKLGDLKGIRDSVRNLEHVARYADKIRLLQDEVDFKSTVARWTAHLDKQPVKFHTAASAADRPGAVRSWGRWAMAQMTKIPWMASWLDGGERTGLSYDILVKPMTDAYDAEIQLWNEVGKPVLQALNNRSPEDIKRHNTKLYIPEIKGTAFHTGNLMGHEVLAVALNTGNAGNLRKMLLGEGWAHPEKEDEISIDNPKLQAVLKHMTKSDWDLVQLIWDQMELLYPKLADVHRRSSGIVPPKVQRVPVQTPFGEYSGGYYPVKYDPNRSQRAAENEKRAEAETDSMFSSGASLQASVSTGATEARTGFYDPIKLSLNVVDSHFQEVIHYITHHEPVRQINRLIRNPQVKESIVRILGPDEYNQLRPWLNDIAKDGRAGPNKNWIDSVFNRLRFGTTLGVMGFKVSTGLMQVLGLSNAIAEVGPKHMAVAAKMIFRAEEGIRSSWAFANERSKVLNHRATTMDREIRSALQRVEGKRGVVAAVQEASMKHIAYIQTYLVDLPTWYAAYSKGMSEWGDEQRAYEYADWVVENIQGSGATKDLPSLLRNQSKLHTTFTMFMTFFSALWNAQRDVVRTPRSVTNVAAKIAFMFAIPTFVEMWMRGDISEDDDDDLEEYLLKTALLPVQTVPVLREGVNALTTRYGYNETPVAGMIEKGLQGTRMMATRVFTDDEITKSMVKNTSKLAAAAAGVPGVSQAWATGEHLYEVIAEGEELLIRGLIFGPKYED